MPKNVIQAKVLRCRGSEILAETRAKNQMFLFLGHSHPEYKRLKKGQVYQFYIDIFPSFEEEGKIGINIDVKKNYLLDYEFKGGSVYEGYVHGEIIKSYRINNKFKHWIKVDCGIINWRYCNQIDEGTFVRIKARLDVEKIYDLNDNLIEPKIKKHKNAPTLK
jgi:hypothetical protein